MTGCYKVSASEADDKALITDYGRGSSGGSDKIILKTTEITTTVKNTDFLHLSSVKSEKTDLQNISEELALQMTKGKFDGTYKKFAPAVSRQITKNGLKDAWDATVQGMGKYIGVYSNTKKDNGNFQEIIVVLQYEYNGLKITFAYNNAGQINGLLFSYSPIEEEAVKTDTFEEIKISFGKGKYPVTGIMTLPKKVTKPPVAILVPGSGNHDVNETVGANKPFRDLAWKLAEQGIASIRYNERIFLYPELLAEGDFTIQTDCLKDASDAISYASKSKKVDKSRIYVIGHSLGGMMAPKIAKDNPNVAAIVLLAGSPRRLEDIIYDQNEAALNNTAGITTAQIKINMAFVQNGVKQIKELKESGTNTIMGYPSSYWYSLNQIDTGKLAAELTIPIYIAQGSADFQVYADKDYTAWQELLKKNTNVTFKLYDNLNHLFMKSNGKKDITEYNTPGKFDQKVIDDIAAWIKNK
jgi:dienelactone hydrolase